MFAVYNPESGPVELSARHGGRVDIDQSGLEGAPRNRVETDLGVWHWENLSFPAGVRVGPFQSTSHMGVSAVARFGATGLDGRLSAGAFRNPADAVLQTRSGALLAVRWNADGSFHVDSTDVLPPNQYLLGTVLTDRQQRRQDLYRRLFGGSKSAAAPEQDRLFVWMDTDELPFDVSGAARTVGTMLFIVPIRYENASEGSFTVPIGFVTFAAALRTAGAGLPKLQLSEPIQMRLRVQVPEQSVPYTVERAVLHLRVRAPERKFSGTGIADGLPDPIQEQLGPAGPIRVEESPTRGSSGPIRDGGTPSSSWSSASGSVRRGA